MPGKVLVLSPHTDDAEIGCGATIAKLIENGWKVHFAVFSMAEKSVPKGWPRDTLRKEVLKALESFGIQKRNYFLYNFEVREFPKYRQEILEELVKLQRKIKPDLVLTPSSTDTHQDHQTMYNESVRAFKQTTVLGYEEPWNNIVFKNHALVPISERHLKKKIKAMRCYKSQLAVRDYFNEDFIRSLAITRGTQMKIKYAEGFEVIRWSITKLWI